MPIQLVYQAVDIELDAESFGASFVELFSDLDTTDLHADIGEHLLNSTDERFEAERAPDGTAWAPNSPATLVSQYKSRGRGRREFKRGKGGSVELTAGFSRFLQSKRILQDKGVRGGLRGDISYRADNGSVALGVTKLYGRIHQLGGEAARGVVLPARAYLGVSDDDRQVIAGIIMRWARERTGG